MPHNEAHRRMEATNSSDAESCKWSSRTKKKNERKPLLGSTIEKLNDIIKKKQCIQLITDEDRIENKY